MKTEATLLDRAERRYRRLLVFYPRAFRERFAGDLVELFRDVYRAKALDARASARVLFWLRILRDAVRNGLVERARRGGRPLPLGAHRSKGTVMSLLSEDLRHALRALRSHAGLTAVVVMTLALGIGANSAIFTVVHAVLLKPLPFYKPERVVMIYEVSPRGGDSQVSIPDFEDLRRDLRTITGLSVFGGQTANLTGVAEPDRLRAGFVSSSFFGMLGVQPIVGRTFAEGEDQKGAAKTAILDYRTWQRRFGGDPSIIGKPLILNNDPYQVIAVTPPNFEFPIDGIDVWMPLSSYPALQLARNNRSYFVLGRVADEASFEQAASELRQAAANLAAAYPETNSNWSARFEPFHATTVQFVSRNLQLLTGAIAFVLLIACANIANLLLARASGRQREMALRAALGASRARLVRQLLTESLVMAIAGRTLGLLLGAALTDGMLTLVPNLPRVEQVAPNATVVLFTAILSIVTGIVFGILPALRTSKTDMRSALTESTRTGESRSTGRLRATLVVAELALSLVLLVAAGLLIQSLQRVLTVNIGYRPDHLLTLEYRLPRNKYTTQPQQAAFHGRVVEQIARVPGVVTASLASAAPQSGNGAYVGYWRAEDPQPARDAMPRAQYNSVTPDFFAAMETPVIAGRVCTDADTAAAPRTVIVNRYLADRLWPGENAIGRQLRSPDIPVAVSVAGVVGNTLPRLLSMPVTAQIYGCLSQNAGLFATVIARTTGEPMTIARSVQQAIWSVDPDQPMWKIRSGDTLVAGSVQTERFVMLLMACAAGLALLLAGLGTYSVLSYTVQRRSREVGVRMALGATRLDVVRLVLSQTARLTAVGIVAGLAGAFALSKVLATQLFEVSPRDPWTFGVTALVLGAVALIAAWLPARRATGVDPMVTLRTE